MTKMNEMAGLGARITKGAAVAAFVLGCLAPAAFAQTATNDDETDAAENAAAVQSDALDDIANNTAFGDWVVSCQAVTVKNTVCRLVQEQRVANSNQLLARFIAIPAEDGAVLIAQVPMGVYLPGGAVYRFEGKDDLEQRDMVWQTCLNGVCEAAAPLSEDELKLFGENAAILFGYKPTADGEPMVLRVNVEEFNTALELLKEAKG
ncbi:invasion associated locus B family protein [Celeribacter sp.]|uniref:invasion associated locus B family protein n=1 Tax=Celeribacter sp. TaxID=1890673 RepID=UPI003A8D0799